MDTLFETIFGSSSSPTDTGTKRKKKGEINVDTSNMENIYDVQEYTKILTGQKKKDTGSLLKMLSTSSSGGVSNIQIENETNDATKEVAKIWNEDEEPLTLAGHTQSGKNVLQNTSMLANKVSNKEHSDEDIVNIINQEKRRKSVEELIYENDLIHQKKRESLNSPNPTSPLNFHASGAGTINDQANESQREGDSRKQEVNFQRLPSAMYEENTISVQDQLEKQMNGNSNNHHHNSNDPANLILIDEEEEEEEQGSSMNFIFAVCTIYIAVRRAIKRRLNRRRQEAQELGKKFDDVLDKWEKQLIEQRHYSEFKKILLYGIKCNLHTKETSQPITMKVEESCHFLVLQKSTFSSEKIRLTTLKHVLRGKITPVFKSKQSRRGPNINHCFSLISTDRFHPVDIELDEKANSAIKAIEWFEKKYGIMKKKEGKTENENDEKGNIDDNEAPTKENMYSNQLHDALEEEGGSLKKGAKKETYLQDKNFYCRGFELLIEEMISFQSFWWDANGSLRRVSLSAFDDNMRRLRMMGILDLDETEKEKAKRLKKEEKERKRMEKIRQNAEKAAIKDLEAEEKERKKEEAKKRRKAKKDLLKMQKKAQKAIEESNLKSKKSRKEKKRKEKGKYDEDAENQKEYEAMKEERKNRFFKNSNMSLEELEIRSKRIKERKEQAKKENVTYVEFNDTIDQQLSDLMDEKVLETDMKQTIIDIQSGKVKEKIELLEKKRSDSTDTAATANPFMPFDTSTFSQTFSSGTGGIFGGKTESNDTKKNETSQNKTKKNNDGGGGFFGVFSGGMDFLAGNKGRKDSGDTGSDRESDESSSIEDSEVYESDISSDLDSDEYESSEGEYSDEELDEEVLNMRINTINQKTVDEDEYYENGEDDEEEDEDDYDDEDEEDDADESNLTNHLSSNIDTISEEEGVIEGQEEDENEDNEEEEEEIDFEEYNLTSNILDQPLDEMRTILQQSLETKKKEQEALLEKQRLEAERLRRGNPLTNFITNADVETSESEEESEEEFLDDEEEEDEDEDENEVNERGSESDNDYDNNDSDDDDSASEDEK